MGLILKPGEVKEMVATAKEIIAGYSEELETAVAKMGDITSESALNGQAYKALKLHMADHVLVANGLVAAGDNFSNSLSSVSDAVGTEDLNEDTLLQCIGNAKEAIEKHEEQISSYRKQLCDPVYAASFGTYAYMRIACLQMVNIAYKAYKTVMEGKLEDLHAIDETLNSIVQGMELLYNSTEQGVASLKNSWDGSGFTIPDNADWRKKLMADIDAYLEAAEEEEDSDDWNVKDQDYWGTVLSGLGIYAYNGLLSAAESGTAEEIAKGLSEYIRYHNPLPVLQGASIYNTAVDIVDSSNVQNLMGKAAKAAPFIGTALDFGVQVASGEDVGDAAVKAGAHTAIQIGVTAAATAIIGATPVGWAAVGVFALGVVASALFDKIYDETTS